jgi:hypothetical protein
MDSIVGDENRIRDLLVVSIRLGTVGGKDLAGSSGQIRARLDGRDVLSSMTSSKSYEFGTLVAGAAVRWVSESIGYTETNVEQACHVPQRRTT